MSLISPTFQKKTSRLVIRPHTIDDFDAWQTSHLSRAKPKSLFDHGPSSTKDVTRAKYKAKLANWRKAAKKDVLYVFGVFDRKTNEHLGTVDIFIQTRFDLQIGNLGYAIHNQYAGAGVASEASTLAMDVAFSQLRLHCLEAGISPQNIASIKVAEKIGLNRICLRKKFHFDGSKWQDMLIYARTIEESGQIAKRPTVCAKVSDRLSQY